jgi:hypothetical protein
MADHTPPRIVADELPLFSADPPELDHEPTPADDGWTWDDTTRALWGEPLPKEKRRT